MPAIRRIDTKKGEVFSLELEFGVQQWAKIYVQARSIASMFKNSVVFKKWISRKSSTIILVENKDIFFCYIHEIVFYGSVGSNFFEYQVGKTYNQFNTRPYD
jgi:hypothetical protein